MSELRGAREQTGRTIKAGHEYKQLLLVIISDTEQQRQHTHGGQAAEFDYF